MAKRIQEQKRKIVSKSRPAVMNVSSYIVATSSSAATSPIASKSPGMSGASVKPSGKMNLDASSFDATSAFQVRVKDAYFGVLMEKQRGNPSHQEEEDSEDSDNSEAEIWYYEGKQVTGEPVARNSKAWEQPLAHVAVQQKKRKV